MALFIIIVIAVLVALFLFTHPDLFRLGFLLIAFSLLFLLVLVIAALAPHVFLIAFVGLVIMILPLIYIATKREKKRKQIRDEEGHRIWLEANRPRSEDSPLEHN
jgi:lysylphosphatidylglycerol synthetase-like protein (DUF2156 family)